MSDVFLSYKRENQGEARTLAEAIERHGWTVWWDRQLRSGEHVDKVIEHELTKAKCVIVLWSHHSIGSDYVLDEVTYALKLKKLIPVAIATVEPPFRFQRLYTRNLAEWDGSQDFPEFKKLVDDIAKILGPPPAESRGAEAERSKAPLSDPTSWAILQPVGPGHHDQGVHHTPHATEQTKFTVNNSIGMTLVRIEPGEFLMGTTKDQLDQLTRLLPASKREWLDDEQPQHPVKITRPFFLGIHEVIVGQFRLFAEKSGYRTEAEKDGKGSYVWYETKKAWVRDPLKNWRKPGFPQTDEHPVVCVSHNDAMAFCQWLSQNEGRTYRLPTEAEWEFACRADTTALYSSGDDPEGLVSIANVADATFKREFPDFTCIKGDDGYPYTASVGSFAPNRWGLYDMIGNVWEWCADWYDEKYYASSPATDPPGAPDSSRRVFRGGSWGSFPWLCRPAGRNWDLPEVRDDDLGFRVAADQE